ncbi:MAG: M1 family metallopeptidase [Lentisphaeria bacterium]|nr:M1 family metallopeptidase [Candidatus Neomarinimicrobiota bacterium]MCF7841772.1 M1 family metallopeptidase [Lentisphaeria bacterium]
MIRTVKFIFLAFVFTRAVNAYWQQEVQYHIAVTLNDTTHTLTANQQLLYINHSPDTLTGLWMHLWPNGYRDDTSELARERMKSRKTRFLKTDEEARGWLDLGEVTADSRTINWHTKSDSTDLAWFELNESLLPGDSVQLNIPFQVKIPKLTSRLGHLGQHYEITQWYPKPAVYDATGWHPMPYRNWGEFYSEFGKYTVAITLPENYVVAATGVLQSPDEQAWLDSLTGFGNALLDSIRNSGGEAIPDTLTALRKKSVPASSGVTKTIIFHQDNVHDFAWFADKQFLVTRDSTLVIDADKSESRPVVLWNFVLPRNFSAYRYGLTYLKAAIDSCSSWFWPYPYQQCTVVDGDISAGGGMEYPMITVVNASGWQAMLDLVIFHEVTHNWFYGLAGFNERRYPWMDEGFTSYAERRYTRHPISSTLESTGFKDRILNLIDPHEMYDIPLFEVITGNLDQIPNLPSEAFEGNNYRFMVYDKPAVGLAMLEARVGQAKMDSAWKDFFREWRWRHPQPEDVRQSLETSLGMDLGWYFDGIINSRAKMDYGISRVNSSLSYSGWKTTFRLKNHGELIGPVPVVIQGANDQKKQVWINGVADEEIISISTDFMPRAVQMDPDGITLDMNRVNDGSGIQFKFRLTPNILTRPAGYTIRYLPGVWWNPVDKFLPALWLNHPKSNDPFLQWQFNLQYGTITKQWYTTLAAQRQFSLPWVTKSEVNFRWRDNWYTPLLGLGSRLVWSDVSGRHQTSLRTGYLHQAIFMQNPSPEEREMLDNRVWDPGIYNKGEIRFTRSRSEMDYKWRTELAANIGTYEKHTSAVQTAPQSSGTFTRVVAGFQLEKRYSHRVAISWSLFGGNTTGAPPEQELIYLSSSIDPDMAQALILSRSADNWIAPNQGIFLEQIVNIPGYGLSGATPFAAEKILGGSITMDLDLPLKFMLAAGYCQPATAVDWTPVGSFTPYVQLGPLKYMFPMAWIENGEITGGFQFQLNFQSEFTLTMGN